MTQAIEKPATAATIDTTRGADVVGMLADLARTATTDTTTPVLGLIRLHTEGRYLHGWSSDRYRAAHARVRVDGDLPRVVFIHATDVKALASTLRRAQLLRLTVDHDTMTFTDFAVTHSVRLVDEYTYPEIHNACRDELPAGTAPGAIDGSYLADFCAIAKRRGGRGSSAYLELRQNDDTRPMHVRIGEDYRAWVMPVRNQVDDDAWLPQSW
ncbi:hypothetical protein [Amycolatopsis jejuensis]|uniref:hypothetical protein n=1 Tax=Amycolatopsis jejuensis TaxID=330084 RepID=UPI0005264484|nr:hypothetical protein [Amycolatopsis jejuensis]